MTDTTTASRVIAPQSGDAVDVAAGATIVVTDLDGAQIADMWAFRHPDSNEHLSAGQTRLALQRLFPVPGETFYSNHMAPMLRFVEDRSPGFHDMLCAACNPGFYAQLGMGAEHRSCAANFERLVSERGIHPGFVPQPVNLFQNTPVTPEGTIAYGTPATKAGDSVVLEALVDLTFVVTACSFDAEGVNGDACSRIGIDVTGANAA